MAPAGDDSVVWCWSHCLLGFVSDSFVVDFLVSFFVWQWVRWGWESWLLQFICVLTALWPSVFCSSRCRGLVFSVWVWHFLVKQFLALLSVIVLCFVVRYFMSILVLQSSWWGRESWLLCLICLPGFSWWLSCSSSRCHGVVCGLWLWYFLIILTYYFLLIAIFGVSRVNICSIAIICIYIFNLNKTFTVLSLSEFLNISASVCHIKHIKWSPELWKNSKLCLNVSRMIANKSIITFRGVKLIFGTQFNQNWRIFLI